MDPAASDFNVSRMELVHDGTEKTVTITPKAGKSPEVITVYYNGSTDPKPKDIGSYTVTFNVAKAAGWNAAAGLSAGTLEIVTAGTPTLSDYTITGLGVQIADDTAKTVSAVPKAGASPGEVTVLYGESKSTNAPSAAGSYAITLQVAAAAGFYAAELDAGTMEIVAPLMTMTTTKAGEVTIILRGTGNAAIYWGDSPTPDTKTLSSYDSTYKHTYTVSGNKTIAIVGEGSVSYLACSSNQLSTLDVSKNTALTDLYCGVNKLEAGALNDLFETLHSNSGTKRIYITRNPGRATCDRTIAMAKGWAVF